MIELVAINKQQAQDDVAARNQSIPWLRMQCQMYPIDQLEFYESLETASDKMYFHIQSHQNHRIVGICGLYNITRNVENPSAEFALLIYPKYRKQGYGYNALFELLKIGFETMDTIYGETFLYPKDSEHGLKFIYNKEMFKINPAWMIFKKIGFKIDGISRKKHVKYGKCIDSLLFSMTKEDWEKDD